MLDNYTDILESARNLPEPKRIELVDALIDTLKPTDAAPLNDAWLAEIDRRSREFDAGLVEATPWSVVRERVRRRDDGDA